MRKLLPKVLLMGINSQLIKQSLARQGYNVSIGPCREDSMSILEYYDYIIIDLKIVSSIGWTFITKLKSNPYLRNSKFIAITANDNPDLLEEASSYDIDDFIFKPFDLSELVARLKILELKIKTNSSETLKLPFKYDKEHKLTAREEDILHNISLGYSNKEIATKLILSEQTVKTHLRKIFFKLSVNNRLQAALVAIKEGFAS